jgi:membrane protease YdiL (CAAX protease family)
MKFSIPLLAVILLYTWILDPLTPGWAAHVVTLLVVGLSLAKAIRSGEWGLRPAAFLPALLWATALTLPALAVLYAVGSGRGTLHARAHLGRDLALLMVWAAGQQFALETVLLREAQAVTSRRTGIVLAAALFGALHLPNPFLAPVTFLAALGWCWIYDRHPNLLPLALSHAVSTLVILSALDAGLTGRLRIGYAYLQLE